jgi:hypothetical protein
MLAVPVVCRCGETLYPEIPVAELPRYESEPARLLMTVPHAVRYCGYSVPVYGRDVAAAAADRAA